MILWLREQFSQSKFKGYIESLNTDDVLKVIPKIERKNAIMLYFNLTCDVFFPTPYNCELEYKLKTCIPQWKMAFFNANKR